MQSQPGFHYSRRVELLVACGLVISFNGYDSRVVDQCYRLPLLERLTKASAFPLDQFVDAFEKFNPHLGYLRLLQFGSVFFGLSITLFTLYCLTLTLTIHSFWRIRESIYPEMPRWSNWLLLLLFVLCKAGNLGTNHLWEDHLLDRQIAFSLGWYALAIWIGSQPSIAIKIPFITGVISLIHPGLGLLNLALWLTLFGWNYLTGFFRHKEMIFCVIAFFFCMMPWAWLYLGQSAVLKAGVSPDLFWSLATELQGPQHMRPSLWRGSQWCASISLFIFSCVHYLLLTPAKKHTQPYRSASQWLLFITAGLFISWPAIEYFHNINITLAQPWRLATAVRGFLLVILNSIIFDQIKSNQPINLCRALSIIFGLRNDMVTFSLIIVEIINFLITKLLKLFKWKWLNHVSSFLYNILTFCGIWWVYDNDPQQGHYLIITGYLAGLILSYILRRQQVSINHSSGELSIPLCLQIRPRNAIAFVWFLPFSSIVCCGFDYSGQTKISQILAAKWRVYETPRSDAEKMGFWLNKILPQDAMILSPPRDKSIRLWSHRSIVANVAGSPYQAEELKKWAERISILCGFSGDLANFAGQWPDNRVKFETYYEKASPDQVAVWAKQFQANVIVVPSSERFDSLAASGWEKTHVQGRLAAWLPK